MPEQGTEWIKDFRQDIKDFRQEFKDLRQEFKDLRQELHNALSTKVSTDLYNADLRSIREDIEDLRLRPERMHASVGTITSVICCVTTVLSLLVTVVLLLHQYWH